MDKLPNYILIESYQAAKKLQLNPEFVSLMQKEIIKRKLKIKRKQLANLLTFY